MIELWTNTLETAIANLRTEYSNDVRTIINENDLKYKVRQHIEALATDENDMLVKPEVPWYDNDAPGHRVKFYFDLTVFRKSIFNLQFGDNAVRNKGYYYNDCSLAIMKKFAKPNFNFAEIADDLNKLNDFAIQTADHADMHKPVLIIGCSSDQLYNQASGRLASELAGHIEEFVNRLTVFLLSPNNNERLG